MDELSECCTKCGAPHIRNLPCYCKSETQTPLEENARLKKALEVAVKFLRQAKAQFRPNTTNSDVDVFLSGVDAILKGEKT